jgi:hypothetical protein
MMKDIKVKDIHWKSCFSTTSKSLLESLLVRNPKNRLGYGKNGIEEIMNHKFFHGIDWTKLREKKIKAPYKPKTKGEGCTRNIDNLFTEEKVVDTPVDSKLS